MKSNNLFKYDIAVIGLGYVGLPLMITAAKAEMKCLGIDINHNTIESLNNNFSHIDRVTNNDLVISSDNLTFVDTYDHVSDAQTIVLCVPTPLKDGEPYTAYIESVMKGITNHIKKEQLIILESTTYPQHTLTLSREIGESTNLKVGSDFYMCFSPEREDPGNQSWNTKTTPKVVGGITSVCTDKGYEFYKVFIDTVVKAKTSTSAELSKLLENTQRLINIAFMNEFKIICEALEEDINHVIDLSSTKPFGFTDYRPGPGVGGHCIPIDPFYLQWKYKKFDSISYLIEASRKAEIRNRETIIEKLSNHINSSCKDPSEVLYVGLSYKANVGDIRSSVAYDIALEMNKNYLGINFYDPLVSAENINALRVIDSIDDCIKKISTVIIMVNHDVFDFKTILYGVDYIFDSQNVVSSQRICKEVILL
jgi:UDP-N-acetyl-D-glucosamine dehydrogenase